MIVCEICKNKEATIHLTQVIDGAVKKVHLCEACAAQSGFDAHGPMSITDILLGMGHAAEPVKVKVADRSCPRCHMRRADFKKSGRLGCSACYEAFEDELAPLIKVMHRKDQHVGKIPRREKQSVRVNAEIIQLQRDLERAIAREDFEEAARIRDRIQACRDQIKQNGEADS